MIWRAAPLCIALVLTTACNRDETISGQVGADDIFVLTSLDGMAVPERITM